MGNGNPAFIARSKVPDGTVRCHTEAGVAVAMNAGFPLSLLRDSKPGTRAKVGALTTCIISVEFSSPIAPTGIGLQNHNLVGAGAGIDFVKAASVAGPWTSVADLTNEADEREKFLKLCTPGAAALVWGVRLSTLGSLAEALAIGELVFGDAQTLSRNVEWGGKEGKEYREVGRESEFGFKLSYFLSSGEIFEGEMPDGLSTSERTELAAFYEAVKGTSVPFFFSPNIDEYETGVGKGYVAVARQAKFDPSSVSVGRFRDVRLEVTEQSYGRPVAT